MKHSMNHSINHSINRSGFLGLWLATIVCAMPLDLLAYPLDGYKDTGIRRLEAVRLANEGVIPGDKQPAGALLSTEQVDLRLLDYPDLSLPEVNDGLNTAIAAFLGEKADVYSFALLDLSNPESPTYAEHQGHHQQNVGSVGKLVSLLGLFQTLADTWPDSLEKRTDVLRNTQVISDNFVVSDHHTVRLFDVATSTLVRRPMQIGDAGSLWEYLDWTLSVSSNSAASMFMREAMLLRHYGQQYPVSEEEIDNFLSKTPASELTRIFQQTFWEPVTRNGMNLDEIRQGSFFTAQGQKNISGGGMSYATARSLMQLMLLMEQGKLVDAWSSLQMKRLMYQTERRIRYASSPKLNDAAVYFKSGSLFRCKPEEGFTCVPYAGNVVNYMNSVAIIEQEIEGIKLHYIVVVLSNILRKNSATEHQALGVDIHNLMRQRHGLEAMKP